MDGKKENRSLFLYTALIFIAAIVIIAVSFFSQINLENKHNEYTGEENSANTITERTAQLSEENMILLETTRTLNQHNAQLMEEKKALEGKVSELEKQVSQSDTLYKIFNLLKKGDKEQAKQLFDSLDASAFDGEQLAFYEYIKTQINN